MRGCYGSGAFDEAMDFAKRVLEQEMHAYRGLSQEYHQDYLEGGVVDASEGDETIRCTKRSH